MSRIKNLSRGAWMVVGIVIGVLLVPTAAFATLSFVGIEGTSLHKADVTPAGQVLTAAATPANAVAGGDVILGTSFSAFATPLAGKELVITSIQIDFFSVPAGSSGSAGFEVMTSGCASQVGFYDHDVTVSTVGPQNLQFNPGLTVPIGDVLCGEASASTIGILAAAIGYTAP